MVTVTELNRAPDGRFKSVTSDNLTVNDTTDTDALNTDELSHNIENGTNKTGSRAFNTEYQNTSGNVKLVIIVLEVANSGEVFNAGIQVSNNSGLGFQPDTIEYIVDTAATSDANRTLFGIVPDGAFYQVEVFTANQSTIRQWFERGYL